MRYREDNRPRKLAAHRIAHPFSEPVDPERYAAAGVGEPSVVIAVASPHRPGPGTVARFALTRPRSIPES